MTGSTLDGVREGDRMMGCRRRTSRLALICTLISGLLLGLSPRGDACEGPDHLCELCLFCRAAVEPAGCCPSIDESCCADSDPAALLMASTAVSPLPASPTEAPCSCSCGSQSSAPSSADPAARSTVRPSKPEASAPLLLETVSAGSRPDFVGQYGSAERTPPYRWPLYLRLARFLC